MSVLHAILLGLVQGLTEFLPVSSSGHLALVPWLFGWDSFGGDDALENAFDVALHLGTLVGAVAYLRSDVARYGGAGMRWLRVRGPVGGDARVAWLLVVTAVPAGLLGLLVLAVTEDLGDRTWLVAVCLIVFGVVMYLADRRPGTRGLHDLRLRDALLLGTAQGLAFQPGVSRAGVTLSVGRGLGLEREAATRLVFLMSLPVVAGAGLVKAADLAVPAGWWPPFVWGTLAAAVSGWLAVHWMLLFVARVGLGGFAAYRVVAGIGVLALLASSYR
jgi:undecaprenyl-diphosphatase